MTSTVGLPALVLTMLVFVGSTRDESVVDAIGTVPPWAIVGATTVLAVLLYAAGCWALRALVTAPAPAQSG